MQQTLATHIQEIAKNLRKQEKEYCGKRKELEGDEGPSVLDKGQTSHEDLMNDAERMEFEGMEQIAMSRDAEINNLVKSINDLAVLFKELSVLVVDQGNILDRIDYNIETAVRHTKKANIELHKVLLCTTLSKIERKLSDVSDQIMHHMSCRRHSHNGGSLDNKAHVN